MPRRPILTVVVAGLALSLGSVSLAQPEKKPVKTADDLPRHTYTIEGKASEFVCSDEFGAFLQSVRADAEGDLAGYDITDPTTLQGYYALLQQAATLEGRYDEALALTEKIRALEAKESKRLMTGQVLRAYVKAKTAAGDDAEAFAEAFKSELRSAVGALPWETVREEVVSAKGRAEILSRALVLGQLQGRVDPIAEAANGELSGDVARGLVTARYALDVALPIQSHVAEVYAALIESHKTVVKDIWGERNVALSETEKATPVVVAIWDSGTDMNLFPKQSWTNAKETVNGKDDDGNGFVDDVHGIAYDLDSKPVVELLHPLDQMASDPVLVRSHTKGLMDVQSNVDSPEASALKRHLGSLKPAEVNPFLEDLGLYGNHSHGTHVAGIAADGNPFVRLLPVRITFDFRSIPQHTPTVERYEADAKAVRDSVEYMKKAGVRVVNMSWGGSRGSIEQELEAKGWGKDAQERAEMSRRLFTIQRDALEGAIKSAPEILFIAAAGNADSNNQFEEFIPSGLNLPNLITVGAVDQGGKPTGFTSFGSNVHLYANGFEVESYVPGGERLKFNGTSMAAPQVANLAGKILAINPKLTTAGVIQIITRGGDPMDGTQGTDRLLINPKKSLEMARLTTK